MTQAINESNYYLLCHEADSYLLVPFYKFDRNINGLKVFIVNHELEVQLKLLDFQAHELRRYFDRYYLLLPKNVTKRQETIDSFFSFIANKYESLIDVERNIENINILLDILNNYISPIANKSILDFGCGTGLSSRLMSKWNINIIGVDSCAIMRKISKSNGLNVISINDLAAQSENIYDGAFASYVLHLSPSFDSLDILWSHLKKNGVFVANFHKDVGIKETMSHIKGMGGRICEIEVASIYERHGAYIAFIKQ
jgi:2-polyprenyl-3-methyl-5-hydroxy-6-metoxy-1,4-benzoquinol methylase